MTNADLNELGEVFLQSAVENMAQLVRFVHRGDLTKEQAAKQALELATALLKEVVEQSEKT